MQGDPSMFPDVPDGSTAGYCAVVALGREPSMFSLQYIAPSSFFLSPNAHLPWRTFQCQDTSKVKVVKPRTNVLTERSYFCLLIPVDVTGLGHTKLSIPHLVRSNVLSRASDDAVPAKVFLAPMSVVPGRSHAKTYRLTVRSWLPW